MLLYQFNPPVVQQTDQTPDPLYNPHEVTRVKDILDLHKRGITVATPSNSRSPFTDDREDIVKLSAPNLEADKLFPSMPRMVSQNAHYKSALEQRKVELEHHQKELEKAKKIEELRKVLESEPSPTGE